MVASIIIILLAVTIICYGLFSAVRVPSHYGWAFKIALVIGGMGFLVFGVCTFPLGSGGKNAGQEILPDAPSVMLESKPSDEPDIICDGSKSSRGPSFGDYLDSLEAISFDEDAPAALDGAAESGCDLGELPDPLPEPTPDMMSIIDKTRSEISRLMYGCITGMVILLLLAFVAYLGLHRRDRRKSADVDIREDAPGETAQTPTEEPETDAAPEETPVTALDFFMRKHPGPYAGEQEGRFFCVHDKDGQEAFYIAGIIPEVAQKNIIALINGDGGTRYPQGTISGKDDLFIAEKYFNERMEPLPSSEIKHYFYGLLEEPEDVDWDVVEPSENEAVEPREGTDA